ncbi:MAG TPA: hypothetical protein PK141_04975 [Polyangiaceae bacterium]|nr:hypothetical protein [Polyangiaceae bacterium]
MTTPTSWATRSTASSCLTRRRRRLAIVSASCSSSASCSKNVGTPVRPLNHV